MHLVWGDIEKYLTFGDLAQLARVSRRFKGSTVLGGCRQEEEGGQLTTTASPLASPGFRSYHRFR
ncbi:hypothetical protein ACHAXT_003823 [Thalassiosira profunda]